MGPVGRTGQFVVRHRRVMITVGLEASQQGADLGKKLLLYQ